MMTNCCQYTAAPLSKDYYIDAGGACFLNNTGSRNSGRNPFFLAMNISNSKTAQVRV
jgi:hypothetical protein